MEFNCCKWSTVKRRVWGTQGPPSLAAWKHWTMATYSSVEKWCHHERKRSQGACEKRRPTRSFSHTWAYNEISVHFWHAEKYWEAAPCLANWLHVTRVLIRTILQLLKKFSEFYGTRRFIIVFKTGRQLSLSWARSIQSALSHPVPLTMAGGSCHVYDKKIIS